MALYEDPELENDNEEGTGDTSFRGSIGQTIVKEVEKEVYREVKQEAVGGFFSFLGELFSEDD